MEEWVWLLISLISGVIFTYFKERVLDKQLAKFSQKRNQANTNKQYALDQTLAYLDKNPTAVIELRLEALHVLVTVIFLIVLLFGAAFLALVMFQIIALLIEAAYKINTLITMAVFTVILTASMVIVINRIGRKLFFYVEILNVMDWRRISSIWPITEIASDPEKWQPDEVNPFKEALLIHVAKFGAESQSADVTQVVRAEITKDRLEIPVSVKVFGDPVPYKRKQLLVDFTYKGVRETKIIEEDQILIIP